MKVLVIAVDEGAGVTRTDDRALPVSKARAFVDFAAPRLRRGCVRMAAKVGILSRLCRGAVECLPVDVNSPDQQRT
jgi:hypothetical protein